MPIEKIGILFSCHSERAQDDSHGTMVIHVHSPIQYLRTYAAHISLFSEITINPMLDVFKALSNDVRLKILEWLKDPDLHFSALEKQNVNEAGICVGAIQKKAGLSPSTASAHLSILQRAGLVEATRLGQWTYYKRNEAAIHELAQQITASL